MSHSFNDSTGQQWIVGITVSSVKDVRAAIGLDLFTLLEKGLEPLGKLLGDPVLFVDVLYLLVRGQAEKAGITDEAFGQRLGGDSLEQAANAFTEALIDFFPGQRQREAARAAMGRAKSLGRPCCRRSRRRQRPSWTR